MKRKQVQVPLRRGRPPGKGKDNDKARGDNSLPFVAGGSDVSPHAARYPWAQWFGAGTVTLVRGKDFHCMPHGMVANVRRAARVYGVRVRLRVTDTTLTVTVEGKTGTVKAGGGSGQIGKAGSDGRKGGKR